MKGQKKVSMSQHAESQHADFYWLSTEFADFCWLLIFIEFSDHYLNGLISAIYGHTENIFGLREPMLLACTFDACRLFFLSGTLSQHQL